MIFPKDYIQNEKFNNSVCSIFLEIVKQIECSEFSILSKLGVHKRTMSYTNLVTTLLERNDFRLFSMLVRYFLLKLPMIKISTDNSAMICGDIITRLLSLSLKEKSFLK